MTVRYVLTRVEPCPKCDGKGTVSLQWQWPCDNCGGTGVAHTEIDADEWLIATLDKYGLLPDGK